MSSDVRLAGGALGRFVHGIERRGASGATPILAAVWIAGWRVMEEYTFVYVPRGLMRDAVVWLGHIALFYLALIVSIAALLRWTTGRSSTKVLPAVAAGLILGVLPPLIDVVVYGPGNFNYHYRLDFFATFPPLLYDPPDATPLGEAVTVWLSVGFMGVYAWVVRSSWWRIALTLIGHYALIVLFLVIVPSSGFALHALVREVSANEAVGTLLTALTFVAFFAMRPELGARALVRSPHALLAPSMVALGAAIAGRLDAHAWLAAGALFVSALVFTLQNDHYDHVEDAAQGRRVLVTRDDALMLVSFLPGLWLTLSSGHAWIALAGVLFLVVTHGYHADPYRLKCVFPLSYKTEGLLALVCLVAGALAPGRVALAPLTVLLLLLVAGGFSVASMLKDFKDVGADRAGGVRTIYVVLTQRGWPEERVHLLVLALLASCLVVGPVWLAANGASLVGIALATGCALAAVTVMKLVRQRGRATWWALVALNGYALTCALALAAQSTPR